MISKPKISLPRVALLFLLTGLHACSVLGVGGDEPEILDSRARSEEIQSEIAPNVEAAPSDVETSGTGEVGLSGSEMPVSDENKSSVEPAPAPQPVEGRSYKIGRGDVISIRVFNEPEMSLSGVKLTETGSINYISLGEIKVEGLTSKELEDLITKSLKGSYLKDPQVSVLVESYRPIFLTGQVAKTGSYPYQPGLTVIKAITLAGGFGPRAAKGDLFIESEESNGQKFKVTGETVVRPGDIIFVDESFF